MIADTDTLQRAIDRLAKAAKSGDKEIKERLAICEKALDALNRAIPVRKLQLPPAEMLALRELHLLTSKPMLYVANVDEASLGGDNEYVKVLRNYATQQQSECPGLCGKIEAEIADLPEEQRPEFPILAGP